VSILEANCVYLFGFCFLLFQEITQVTDSNFSNDVVVTKIVNGMIKNCVLENITSEIENIE
jgi:hypothetical protein